MANEKERRKWYAEHGICVACGQRDALPNRQKCAECTEKATLNNIKYRSLERERGYYQRRKQKREERIASGLCPNCGKAAKYGQLCYECDLKKLKKHEEEKAERAARGDPRRVRVANGKCWFCDNEALPGMKICQAHYTALMHRPGFAHRGGESHPWAKDEAARIAGLKTKWANSESTY